MKKLSTLLTLLLCFKLLFCQDQPNPDPTRFQSEIDNFTEWDAKNSFPEHAVLFAGSSSIRMWKTQDGFPDKYVINRGFGGAHISDMLYYFNQIVAKYQPSLIVFYCGDNDIDYGKSAEQTFADFKKFLRRVENLESYPELIYLPAKPSPARWDKYPEMKRLNDMVRELANKNKNLIYTDVVEPMLNPSGRPDPALFRSDSLHLNEKGYTIWEHIVAPMISVQNIMKKP